MEKQEKINLTIRIFTYLMRETIRKSYVFPNGGITKRTMISYVEALESIHNDGLCEGRIVDYCICQVYEARKYSELLLKRWNASYSFGKKAIQRYCQNTNGKRYYEDVWLKGYNISRDSLIALLVKKEHPLQKFINPEYEERTKQRMLNSEVGFYICQISTLLWTPLSESCKNCKNNERCIKILKSKYPELYRLRMEESIKQKKE